jgi:carbamoyltransferase
MFVLGLNLTQTTAGLSLMDGAAALVSDEGILGAIAEERLTRKKHDGGIVHAVGYLLESRRLTLADVDLFAVSICCDVPPDLPHALRVLAAQGLEIPASKVFLVPSHHLAHAASAFFTSPFDEALVFVTDNEGNILDPVQPDYRSNALERTSYYLARGTAITLLDRDATGPGDWGLGNVYGAATQWFGYPSYQHAGKFMGAAAYGDPDAFADVELFELDGEGRIVSRVEPLFDKALAVRRAFFRQTRERRGAGVDIGWNAPESVFSPSQTQFDVAWRMQDALERVAVRRIARLVEETGVRNLAVAGGVGLNCMMNQRLLEETGVERIHVLPAPGDDGQSLGNALLALFERGAATSRDPFVLDRAGLGRCYPESEIGRQLAAHSDRVHFRTLVPPDLLRETAGHIADGRIVFWFQGRSEFGPRALGHRSILADPRRAEMKDLLNLRIKHREGFRPFCPSVLAERSHEYFGTLHSPFMNVASRVRADQRSRIPAVVHHDGTARAQTVREEANPLFHGLLREFEAITGIPLLLNTSFNNCEPIVESPGDAIRTFLHTGGDLLVIGNCVATKIGDDNIGG